jgi:hypothetical protein
VRKRASSSTRGALSLSTKKRIAISSNARAFGARSIAAQNSVNSRLVVAL